MILHSLKLAFANIFSCVPLSNPWTLSILIISSALRKKNYGVPKAEMAAEFSDIKWQPLFNLLYFNIFKSVRTFETHIVDKREETFK